MGAPGIEQYLQILLADQKLGLDYIPRAIELSGNGKFAQANRGATLEEYYAVHQILDSHAVTPSFAPGEVMDRAAYLLNAIEEFGGKEIARVIGISSKSINEIVARGRELFVRKFPANILILEDEPIIATDLQNIVGSLGYQKTAVAHTQAEAISKAKAIRPDLILADINLGSGGSGLVAVKEVDRSRSVMAIFITAYPERLVAGDGLETSYLITKPFLPQNVRSSVLHAVACRGRYGVPASTSGHGHSAPSPTEGSYSDSLLAAPVAIRNRQEVALYADYLVASLQQAVSYHKNRQHNQPPPAMWLDNEDYLAELRAIIDRVSIIAVQMNSPNTPKETVEHTIIDFRKHANTFLENYAASLGKGAAYGTLCILVALLSATGWGGQTITKVIALIHSTK